MGRFSRLVFGRNQLPQGCLVCGGAYAPWKKEVVRRAFSHWTRLSGHLVNYSFASANGRESLVLFNVYGASIMLETLQILRDGGTGRHRSVDGRWMEGGRDPTPSHV